MLYYGKDGKIWYTIDDLQIALDKAAEICKEDSNRIVLIKHNGKEFYATVIDAENMVGPNEILAAVMYNGKRV